ncbi:MAG: 30S ribosomal protein S17 [Ktedonobacterales bacterium]|nr:30S ribosomal protein S17 [Ktedonobacterales bacterium]
MTTPEAKKAPHRAQTKTGKVISDKMQKTIVVAVESFKQHPLYKKNYRWTKHYKAHDEENTARMGDTVIIQETRPLSKEKRWLLLEIVKRGSGAPAVDDVAKADLGGADEKEEA